MSSEHDAMGCGAGIYGAIIRVNKYDYRIRTGGVGETRFVIEPVGENQHAALQESMQEYVTFDYPELHEGYIPHWPAAMAKIMEKRLGAQILHIEMPEPLPEGVEPDIRAVH